MSSSGIHVNTRGHVPHCHATPRHATCKALKSVRGGNFVRVQGGGVGLLECMAVNMVWYNSDKQASSTRLISIPDRGQLTLLACIIEWEMTKSTHEYTNFMNE